MTGQLCFWCPKKVAKNYVWISVNQRQGLQPTHLLPFYLDTPCSTFHLFFEDTCRGIDWGSGFSYTLAWWHYKCTTHTPQCQMPGGLDARTRHENRSFRWKHTLKENIGLEIKGKGAKMGSYAQNPRPKLFNTSSILCSCHRDPFTEMSLWPKHSLGHILPSPAIQIHLQ